MGGGCGSASHHPCFRHKAETPVGNSPSALKKSKNLPNRAGDRRFLDGFKMRITVSVAGRPGLVNKNIKN
jgi:hypothetical protein